MGISEAHPASHWEAFFCTMIFLQRYDAMLKLLTDNITTSAALA